MNGEINTYEKEMFDAIARDQAFIEELEFMDDNAEQFSDEELNKCHELFAQYMDCDEFWSLRDRLVTQVTRIVLFDRELNGNQNVDAR